MTQIQIGDDRKTVRSKFVAGNYQEIRLDDIPEIGKWMLVSTPFEFGAGNWTLYIHLQNEKVSALRLRTNDSMDERPHDPAPADITD